MVPNTCPLCGKILLNPRGIQQAGRRICSLCGDRIKKNHKYHIGSDGRLEHRNCKNPSGKVDTETTKGFFD